jgi:hypothetical protein
MNGGISEQVNACANTDALVYLFTSFLFHVLTMLAPPKKGGAFRAPNSH